MRGDTHTPRARGQLEEFKGKVEDVTGTYATINTQLADAEASWDDKEKPLLSDPDHAGTEGPPVQFAEACKTTVDKYRELLSVLIQIHTVAHTRFDQMVKDLGLTHELYARLEAQHTDMFNALLNRLSSDGS